MSIKDLIDKYGYTGSKEGWFELKEPSIDDVKRIVAKGKLEERSFRIPIELRKYMDITPEGKLVDLKPIPEDLQDMAKELRATWERIHNPEDLTEY